ncbi:phage tail assembly chaperone [Pseudomonas sp. LH21]|uniref:phage tail assembly chaperone n=1 Tax=Pseudomonas sp. LH21 TaxID=3114884 RepID=UPI002F91CE4B
MGIQDLTVESPAITWLYSFAEPGWYSPEYNFIIPDDAVAVPEAQAIMLKNGLAAGKVVVKGDDGMPVLGDPPPPTGEALAETERRWRDRQLLATDPLVTRHRDELELVQPCTLSAEDYLALQHYRAALRQWPESQAFPGVAKRPSAPPWLDDLLT